MATVITGHVTPLQVPNRALYEAGPIAVAVLVVLLIWGCNWKGGSKKVDETSPRSTRPKEETKTDDPTEKAKENTDEVKNDPQIQKPVDPNANKKPETKEPEKKTEAPQRGDNSTDDIEVETPVGSVTVPNVPVGAKLDIKTSERDLGRGGAGFGQGPRSPGGSGGGMGFGGPGGPPPGNSGGSSGSLGGGPSGQTGGVSQTVGGVAGNDGGSGGQQRYGQQRGNQMGGNGINGAQLSGDTRFMGTTGSGLTSLEDTLAFVRRNAKYPPVEEQSMRAEIDIPFERERLAGKPDGVPGGHPLSANGIDGFKLPDLLPEHARAATELPVDAPVPLGEKVEKPLEVDVQVNLNGKTVDRVPEKEEQSIVKETVKAVHDGKQDTVDTPGQRKVKVTVNVNGEDASNPEKLNPEKSNPEKSKEVPKVRTTLTRGERARIAKKLALEDIQWEDMTLEEAIARYAIFRDSDIIRFEIEAEEAKATLAAMASGGADKTKGAKNAAKNKKPVEIALSPVKVTYTGVTEKEAATAAAEEHKIGRAGKMPKKLEAAGKQPVEELQDDAAFTDDLADLQAQLQKVQGKVAAAEAAAVSVLDGSGLSAKNDAKQKKRAAKIQKLTDKIKALEAAQKAAQEAADEEREDVSELEDSSVLAQRATGSRKAKTRTKPKTAVAPDRTRRLRDETPISDDEPEVDVADPQSRSDLRKARQSRSKKLDAQARAGGLADPDDPNTVYRYQTQNQPAAQGQPQFAPIQGVPPQAAAPAPTVVTVNGGAVPYGTSAPAQTVVQPGYAQQPQSIAPIPAPYQSRSDPQYSDFGTYSGRSRGPNASQTATTIPADNASRYPPDSTGHQDDPANPNSKNWLGRWTDTGADAGAKSKDGAKAGATKLERTPKLGVSEADAAVPASPVDTTELSPKVALAKTGVSGGQDAEQPIRNKRQQSQKDLVGATQEVTKAPVAKEGDLSDQDTDGSSEEDNTNMYDFGNPYDAPDIPDSPLSAPAPISPDMSRTTALPLTPEPIDTSLPAGTRDSVPLDAVTASPVLPAADPVQTTRTLEASTTAQNTAINGDGRMDHHLASTGLLREEQHLDPSPIRRVRSTESLAATPVLPATDPVQASHMPNASAFTQKPAIVGDDNMDDHLASTGFLRNEQHLNPRRTARVPSTESLGDILSGSNDLRAKQHHAPAGNRPMDSDTQSIDDILQDSDLRAVYHNGPGSSSPISHPLEPEAAATGSSEEPYKFSSPWDIPPETTGKADIDSIPISPAANVAENSSSRLSAALESESKPDPIGTTEGPDSRAPETARLSDVSPGAAQPDLGQVFDGQSYGPGDDNIDNTNQRDSGYVTDQRDSGYHTDPRGSKRLSDAPTLVAERSPVRDASGKGDTSSPPLKGYADIEERIKQSKAAQSEADAKTKAEADAFTKAWGLNDIAKEKERAKADWNAKQGLETKALDGLGTQPLIAAHHGARQGMLDASGDALSTQRKKEKKERRAKKQRARRANAAADNERLQSGSKDAGKSDETPSQRITPPPEYMATERSGQGAAELDDSRGLIRATWFVITHAKLYSLLTTTIVTISAEGTRQITAQMMKAGTATTSALAERDNDPSLGPDIELTQPLLTKILGDSGLSNRQWFIILQLWVMVSLTLSLLSLSATIAKAYAPNENTTLRSEITCGWGIIYKAVKRFVIRLLGAVFMSPNWSWRRSSWIYTTGRLLIFTALVCVCALVIRQALSLQYLSANKTTTSFSQLPDITKSQKTLSKVDIDPTTSFLILNAIFGTSILVIFGGWYAVTHARAFTPNAGHRLRTAIFSLSTLKPIGAVFIIITYSCAIWFFDRLTVYTNPAFKSITSQPEFIFKNVLIATYMLPLFWSVFELWDLGADLVGQYGFFGWGKREIEDRRRTTERVTRGSEVPRAEPNRAERRKANKGNKGPRRGPR